MRAAGFAALVMIVAVPAVARADWRDGCPAGNYGEHGTDGRRLAPGPDLVAPIAPSRVMLSAISSYYTQNDQQTERARLLTGVLQVRHNLFDHWHWSATLPASLQFSGDSGNAPRQFGNPIVAVGYARYWKADKVDAHDNPDDVVWASRYAWGIELFARAPWARDALNDSTPDDAQHVELALPFEAYLFAPDGWDLSPWGASFELRRESVGCYAPFVDLHLSALMHGDAQAVSRTTLVAPQTITVGAYVDDNVALMLQYGIVVLYNADATAQQLYVHRFRAAAEIEFDDGKAGLGGNLDLYQGSALLDGTVLALHFSWKWQGGR